MLLAKRNQDLIPTLFNELLDWSNWNNVMPEIRHCTPKMNVSETDEAFDVELCVPGLTKDDLSLSIDIDNNLVVEMMKKAEQEKKETNYLRHEFGAMQFKQMLALPENVKKEKIEARVADGILYITLPKITESEKNALIQTIAIA